MEIPEMGEIVYRQVTVDGAGVARTVPRFREPAQKFWSAATRPPTAFRS